MKQIKFAGMVLKKAGGLMQAEIYGPPDSDTWRACFDVWATAMIMIDALDLGAIHAYKTKVEQMHLRYGENKNMVFAGPG